jgi:hypothetical protein
MSLWEFAKGALLHATLATVATHEQVAPPSIPSSVASVARVAPVACSKGADLDLAAIEERAALAEFDGGVSRPLAEALAWMEVCPPPPGTPPERWREAQDSFAMLVATGATSKALAAGWTPQELCGVSSRWPHVHPDHAGLIFSLRPGDTVTDVRRIGCIIACATVRHIWKRVPLPTDGSIVLPWQLGDRQ